MRLLNFKGIELRAVTGFHILPAFYLDQYINLERVCELYFAQKLLLKNIPHSRHWSEHILQLIREIFTNIDWKI